MRNGPKDTDFVLVYGGGTIGLMTVAVIRALDIKAKIILLAKYPFQAEMAKKLGADEVLFSQGSSLYEEITKICVAKTFKPSMTKPVILNGCDFVFDTIGHTETIDDALRFLKSGGKLVLVGSASVLKNIDWALIWFKELSISGSNSYSTEEYLGKREKTFQIAIDLILKKKVSLRPLLTHVFKISDYKKALETSMFKNKYKSIKVAFDLSK
jgi:threonine dehydrogenase-like Zn-dependent dehydrogenase